MKSQSSLNLSLGSTFLREILEEEDKLPRQAKVFKILQYLFYLLVMLALILNLYVFRAEMLVLEE